MTPTTGSQLPAPATLGVFFTASYYGKSRYQTQYDLVLDALEQTGVNVISPEKGNYQAVLSPAELKRYSQDKNRRHYQAIKKGIKLADAVVIDISYQDFQLGWEAALTVQNKKPLLCLSVNEDFSPKISHPYFHAAKYTEVTIDNLIEDFLRLARKTTLKERFNFFLSPGQLQYLKAAADQTDQSTSEYLRHLIDQARTQP